MKKTLNNLAYIKSFMNGRRKPLDKQSVVLNYVDIINTLQVNRGVYQLGDFYIGRSENIRQRITSHVLELLESENKKVVSNTCKLYRIEEAFKTGRLTVTILDSDMDKEEYHIKKLFPKLPLTNIEFVTPKMIENKFAKIKKLGLNCTVHRLYNRFYIIKLCYKGQSHLLSSYDRGKALIKARDVFGATKKRGDNRHWRKT